GQTWTTIYTETSGSGGVISIPIDGVGRYIRVYGTARGTQYGHSLYELEAYGVLTDPTPVLSGIDIQPMPNVLKQGTTQQFTARGFDQFGNPIALGALTWSSTTGSINGAGLFSADDEGVTDIIATSNGISARISFYVEESTRPNSIEIVPVYTSMVCGGELQMTPIVYDQFGVALKGYDVTWSVDAPNTITQDGLLRAGNQEGTFTVRARYNDIEGTSTVVVKTFNHSNLALQKPATSSSMAYWTFYAPKGNDGDINDNGVAERSRFEPKTNRFEWWKVDLEESYIIETIKIQWYSGTLASQYSIEFSNDEKNWITVYTANQAFATPDVTLPGQTFEQTITIPAGTTGARFIRLNLDKSTSQYPASFWEFEAYGSRFWRPVPTRFDIKPNPGESFVGKDVLYSLDVYDQNDILMTGYDVEWSVSGDAGYFDQDGYFTPTKEGDYIISATVNGITGTAPINIKPAPKVTTIEVTPALATVAVGEALDFVAKCYDQYGNWMWQVEPEWSINNAAGGTVTQVGNYVAGNTPGNYMITVKAGNVEAYLPIEILDPNQERENLALYKDITASSNKNTAPVAYPGYGDIFPPVITDGRVGGRWTAASTTTEWVNIDLGTTVVPNLTVDPIYNISNIEIEWETARACEYDVEFSTDGLNWETVYEYRAEQVNPGGNTTDKLSVNGLTRYIKITMISPATAWNYSIYEVRAFGSTIDPNKATKVVITPANKEVEVGEQITYTAVVYNGFGNQINGAPVTWRTNGGGNFVGNTFTSTTPGTYTIMAESGQIIATTGVIINGQLKPDAPSAIVMSGNRCVGSTVTMSVNAIPGNTFTWTVPAGAQIVSGQGSNSIQVRWNGEVDGKVSVTTNAGGLDSDASELTVQVRNFAAGVIVASKTEINCTDTAINLSVAAGNTYRWSNNSTSNSINVTAGGAYRVTVTNAENCTSSASVSVSEDKTQPNVSINTNNTELTCTRTVITLSASGATNYDWGSATKEVTIGSVYTVVGTNANGCSNTASVTITESNDKPNVGIQVSGDKLTCLVQSITLSATGADSYDWQNGEMVVTTPGTYTVTGTSANGCSATASVEITQDIAYPNVSITPTAVELNCRVTEIELVASGADTYDWDGGRLVVTNSGDYVVKGTNSSNGCYSIETITIDKNDTAPSINITGVNDITCQNSTIELRAENNAQDAEYTWSTGENGQSISVSVENTYVVTVTDRENGCSSNESVTINENKEVVRVEILGNEVLTCTKSVITLEASANYAESYQWSNNSMNQTVEVSAEGEQSVTVTYGVCSASASVNVSESNERPIVSIADTETELTCDRTSIVLQASGADSYDWQNGEMVVTTPGTYTVTGTNANGCSATASVEITQNVDVPTVTIRPSADKLTCDVTAITLQASGADSYDWQNGEMVVTTPGTYTVTGTGANGCQAESSIEITQDIAEPVVTINADETELTCDRTSIVLKANGADRYDWQNGEMVVTAPGTYTVIGTGTNGCQAESSIEITQDIAEPAVTINADETE
ncbi:MAG: discoidin domain-containing protein, partial [Paludibacteraceae bacterium]|nr:discoidin domain-containing protein [Paludibacteraceae bacterium]